MRDQLILLAIQEAPAIIDRLRDLFRKNNPDAPEPQDAELAAAWGAAMISTLAKDDQWRAAHPV